MKKSQLEPCARDFLSGPFPVSISIAPDKDSSWALAALRRTRFLWQFAGSALYSIPNESLSGVHETGSAANAAPRPRHGVRLLHFPLWFTASIQGKNSPSLTGNRLSS